MILDGTLEDGLDAEVELLSVGANDVGGVDGPGDGCFEEVVRPTEYELEEAHGSMEEFVEFLHRGSFTCLMGFK